MSSGSAIVHTGRGKSNNHLSLLCGFKLGWGGVGWWGGGHSGGLLFGQVDQTGILHLCQYCSWTHSALLSSSLLSTAFSPVPFWGICCGIWVVVRAGGISGGISDIVFETVNMPIGVYSGVSLNYRCPFFWGECNKLFCLSVLRLSNVCRVCDQL